ncbi:hypothetical protein [Mycolicibacterium fluoranthenivorans]
MARDEAMTMHPSFTPSGLTAEELDASTVGREAIFDTLVQRITSAVNDGSRPHTLIVAPRGAGKTHTIRVAVHRSLADTKTAQSLLPVFIPEDSLAIGSYGDLLVEIARSIDADLAKAAVELRRHKDTIGIEAAIIDAAGDRMILLAVENLDRVFHNLGQGGQGALRAWVETSTAVTIFATAPMLFSGISSRSYPWYGSFSIQTLPELTVDEGVTMLSRAARGRGDAALGAFIESPMGRERLQVIHRLTGGSPRLWHILSDVIDIESLDALVPAVESLLDRLAPYYQEQLWQLPPSEQRLVVELGRGWRPQTVSDLATAVGITNQSAATALGRLTASRWVTSSKASSGDRRASWYDLTEPLLRYHLQYREDRGKPLRLIVEFLRGFFSQHHLIEELGNAAPGSHMERHLQKAINEESRWFVLGALHDPTRLLGSLRTWMVDEHASLNDIAVILEAVLLAALGDSSPRVAPGRLTGIISDAVNAQSGHTTPHDKINAALRNLRTRAWSDDASDAISVFEFLCSAKASDDLAHTLDSECPAVRERHISPPALMLRGLLGMALKRDGNTDLALAVFSDILDDIHASNEVPDAEKIFMWRMWVTTALEAKAPPPRRHGDTAAGFALGFSLQDGDVRPSDFARAMGIFTEDSQAIVAATTMLVQSRTVGDGYDPRRYVDEPLLRAVDQLIEEQQAERS